jgi:predicted S18 family serine protease
MQNNKQNAVLWAAICLLFAANAYNAYNGYMLSEEIQKLSLQLETTGSYALSTASASEAGIKKLTNEKTIPIVAVSNDGAGTVGNLTVKLIPGNNNVLINTNPFLDTDIQYSANKAVAVAKLRSDYSFDRDFLLDYKAADAQLIGGESAGAAAAIATIAALQNLNLREDTVITGTIEADGTIGEVGGIIEKAKAVADAGYERFLVPEGQSKVTYYERQVSKEPTIYGFSILNTRYVPKTIDLKEAALKEWDLEIIETPDIDHALKSFMAWASRS